MRLSDVIDYWNYRRARGHTHAMLHGLVNAKLPCIVILSSRDMIKIIEKECAKDSTVKHTFMSIDDDPIRLWGLEYPLIVDHFAMTLLIERRISELENLANRYKREEKKND